MKIIRPHFICLLLIASSCDQKEVLIRNTWFLVDAYYNKQPLPILPSGGLTIVSGDGYQFLNFSEDGRTSLPGLGTPAMSGKWSIVDHQIRFVADSSRLLDIRPKEDISFLNKPDYADSISVDTTYEHEYPLLKNRQKITIPDYSATIKFYKAPFDYEIIEDTLILVSSHTTLIAVRDKTPDRIHDILRRNKHRKRS